MTSYVTGIAARIGVALACWAAFLEPWVDPESDAWEVTIAVIGAAAGLLLLVSALFGDRLPAVAVDPAAGLAAAVLIADGVYVLLEYRPWDVAIRVALFCFGAAVVALAIMVDHHMARSRRR